MVCLLELAAARIRYAHWMITADVGVVVIIAWILGALQGVLLRELIGAVGCYVNSRRSEEKSWRQIMSS